MRTKSKELIDAILNVIDEYQEEFGAAPSTREIAAKTGYSNGNISNYINYMEQEGVLVRNGVRSIVTTRSQMKVASSSVPVVGRIACGSPILAVENIEEYVSVPSKLVKNGEYFFLRAEGDSMIDAGILNGSLVLIKQQNTAEYGQIVIALIDNERATLKRYWPDLEKGIVTLHPENRELEDRVYNLSEHEIAIRGVAKFAMTDL